MAERISDMAGMRGRPPLHEAPEQVVPSGARKDTHDCHDPECANEEDHPCHARFCNERGIPYWVGRKLAKERKRLNTALAALHDLAKKSLPVEMLERWEAEHFGGKK